MSRGKRQCSQCTPSPNPVQGTLKHINTSTNISVSCEDGIVFYFEDKKQVLYLNTDAKPATPLCANQRDLQLHRTTMFKHRDRPQGTYSLEKLLCNQESEKLSSLIKTRLDQQTHRKTTRGSTTAWDRQIDPPHEIRGSSNQYEGRVVMVATATKIKWCSVLLAEVGALTIFSFKGEPNEVGIIVPTLQKKKLIFAEVMGTTGTGTQVSGCKNSALSIHKRGFILWLTTEGGTTLCHGKRGTFNSSISMITHKPARGHSQLGLILFSLLLG